MESTNNQTPARSSEEQLKAKYGGKLYRVGITVPVDDESEKEFSYYCWVFVKQFSRNDTATACQDWLRVPG